MPIWSVTVFSGNNDERVFQTYDVEVYKSGDLDYTLLGTVQSGPFNTTYAAAGSPLAAVTSLKDSAGPLAQNVEAIRFTFYPVGNTQNFYQAPASSIVGTWVREIDVAIVPEPGSLLALGGGLVSMAALIRRRK